MSEFTEDGSPNTPPPFKWIPWPGWVPYNPPTSIREVSPTWPQLFHDDYLWIFNVVFFVLSFVGATAVGYHRKTTWLAGFVPAVLAVYYYILGNVLNLPRVDWKQEIVLITGGGSGIGAALAVRLCQHTQVVVLIRPGHATSFPENVSTLHVLECDVSDRAAVAAAAATIRTKVGEPTIVVNNAGVVKGKLLLDLTTEDIQTTFNVNAIAPFYVTQEFLPSMLRKKKGHVMTISSVMGLIPTAQMTDYCASKAASVAFNESLRKELDYRYLTPMVRTTLVLPGHVRTGMFNDTLLPEGLVGALVPSLKTEEVVDAMVKAMEGGPGAQTDTVIRLPAYTQMARLLNPFFGLIPRPILRLSDWMSGAHWAMKAYGPIPDAGERLNSKPPPSESGATKTSLGDA